jgi:hypothetical protein
MGILRPWSHSEWLSKQRSVLVLCGALALCTLLAPNAKADFVDYYAVSNFTLTNIDYFGFDAGTNGSVVTLDGGLSAILIGGDSGSGFGGETDWLINAAASGVVQFTWSYASLDSPPGDWAGYMVGNTFTQLADTNGQSSGSIPVTFSVTAGESFGFVVATADNTMGPGLLTISNFSAPTSDISSVPEPGTLAIPLLLMAAILGAHRFSRRFSPSGGGVA